MRASSRFRSSMYAKNTVISRIEGVARKRGECKIVRLPLRGTHQ